MVCDVSTLSNMKSFNVRHIQHHLAAVLTEVEGGEVIEVYRRGQPVARIVPVPSEPPQSDWSHAERRLREVYPRPSNGITAAETVADGRSKR